MKRKTVFIGHPISGDVEGNVRKVLAICKKTHTRRTIPVVPYLVSLQYLNDGIEEERERGMKANHECFHRFYIDELWLFGDRISAGMKEEVLLAVKIGIPVFAKTKETRVELKKLMQKNKSSAFPRGIEPRGKNLCHVTHAAEPRGIRKVLDKKPLP